MYSICSLRRSETSRYPQRNRPGGCHKMAAMETARPGTCEWKPKSSGMTMGGLPGFDHKVLFMDFTKASRLVSISACKLSSVEQVGRPGIAQADSRCLFLILVKYLLAQFSSDGSVCPIKLIESSHTSPSARPTHSRRSAQAHQPQKPACIG